MSIDRTRLLWVAFERFKLKDDFDDNGWLIAADWIEEQGDEGLAAEVRRTASREPGLFLNPCACGRRSGVSKYPLGKRFIFGWSCDYCARKTEPTISWVRRVILWNLMNPLPVAENAKG